MDIWFDHKVLIAFREQIFGQWRVPRGLRATHQGPLGYLLGAAGPIYQGLLSYLPGASGYLPAVLGPQPHGRGHTGAVLGVVTSLLRVHRDRRLLFGLTGTSVTGETR